MPIRRRSAASSSATSTRLADSVVLALAALDRLQLARFQRQLERERRAGAELGRRR